MMVDTLEEKVWAAMVWLAVVVAAAARASTDRTLIHMTTYIVPGGHRSRSLYQYHHQYQHHHRQCHQQYHHYLDNQHVNSHVSHPEFLIITEYIYIRLYKIYNIHVYNSNICQLIVVYISWLIVNMWSH